MSEYLFILGILAGVAFSHWAPGRIKRGHIRRQDRLIERSRAHYLLAVERLRLSEEAAARELLARIRRIESLWRFGNSYAYRLALAGYAVWIGYLGNVVLRGGSLVTIGLSGPAAHTFTVDRVIGDVVFFAMIGASGAYWALLSYAHTWTGPWIVDDCGDRLERMLNAGWAIDIAPRESKGPLDGLTAQELLGLDYGFSLKELNAARRRLATKFHPDLWIKATALQRRAAEAAMQRVNIAFDELRPRAA